MMVPEIRSLTIDGAPFDQNYAPPDAEVFSLEIRLIAGPKGAPGEESFDFTVCTPKWLDENLQESDVLVARHFVIVKRFNFAQILKRIEGIVRASAGDTWDEVGAKLSRLGRWEFEDYTPRHDD